MNFKQINDQLFELVPHVPLTQDAELPCLVRLIQDDSPMGNRNKSLIIDRIMGKSFTAISMDGYKLQLKEQEICNSHYFYFEVIGIPVADGSAKWALYQMMQGNTVHRDEWVNDMCCKLKDDIVETYVSGILCFFNPIKDWLEFAQITVGWQLYDPQPAYQVGDWVEYHEAPHETSIGYIAELLPDGKASVFFIDEMDIDVVDMSSLSAYDLRKVIVTIGCLSGTVESSPWNDSRFILRTKRGKCWIPKDALDAPTRELVERLLDKEGK